MEKIEARVIVCRFAKTCKNYGYTQSDWDHKEGGMFNIVSNNVFLGDAIKLVPEIWEHVGYWVWQPIRRDR